MNRFFEFLQRHPFLTAGAVLLAVVALVVEFRFRRSAAVAVGPSDAVRLINAGALVVDVRAADAYAAGHIIDARHIPHAELAAQADSLKKYREKPVLLYCDTGATSGTGATALKALGFTKVVNLRGGLAAWKTENMPTVTASAGKGAGKNKGAK